jgi:hypothetical protein
MNTRRGFLENIIKAGVSAMILPSATTYLGRRWIKGPTTLWTTEDVNIFQRLPWYLVSSEYKHIDLELESFKKLLNSVTWTPNMGDTLRGVRV